MGTLRLRLRNMHLQNEQYPHPIIHSIYHFHRLSPRLMPLMLFLFLLLFHLKQSVAFLFPFLLASFFSRQLILLLLQLKSLLGFRSYAGFHGLFFRITLCPFRIFLRILYIGCNSRTELQTIIIFDNIFLSSPKISSYNSCFLSFK